ncbi:hypothetical protein V2J09_003502 [Rumex salicifolius]
MNPIAENLTSFLESVDDACNASDETQLGFSSHNYVSRTAGVGVACQEVGLQEETVTMVSQVSTRELRQRSVSAGAGAGVSGYSEEKSSSSPCPIAVTKSWAGESGKEESNSSAKPRSDQPNGRLQTEGSLDWKQLIADDPNLPFLVEVSPFKYFMEEMHSGNSLKSTTALGNEKEREKVYDTIFHLPRRCELFLSLWKCHHLNTSWKKCTVSTTALGNEKEREKVYDTIFHLPRRCELFLSLWKCHHLNTSWKKCTVSTTALGNEKEREKVYDTIFHLPRRCELFLSLWKCHHLNTSWKKCTVSTTALGNEKEREKVYDTIFHLPRRCELFLSLWKCHHLNTSWKKCTVSTTALGNEKEREKVYDTIFHLPWRCELLINVGFFVCLNSFLSLLTIMPMRILMATRRFLTSRLLKKLSTPDLSDFGCLVILACGVVLLGRTDISLIYHMIRGQGIVKLYVIFDKLWQSISGDILQTLFCTADRLAGCPPESLRYWVKRYIFDLIAVTLSTCIVAQNNTLVALLVSNNFAEIKSNVFKRFSKDNIHNIAYSDSIERFNIAAFLLFVLAQNILEAEGSWFGNFLSNALLVYFCEVAIDILKHSFMAKFNDIKPIAYSEFLEDLCKQTLNIQTESGKKRLTFVPLSPASVVIRVLTPVYAALLPCSSTFWRLLWIVLLTLLTFAMLVSLKVLTGMVRQKHAAWYILRCQRKELHSD